MFDLTSGRQLAFQTPNGKIKAATSSGRQNSPFSHLAVKAVYIFPLPFDTGESTQYFIGRVRPEPFKL